MVCLQTTILRPSSLTSIIGREVILVIKGAAYSNSKGGSKTIGVGGYDDVNAKAVAFDNPMTKENLF